jgi:hypothetical protein
VLQVRRLDAYSVYECPVGRAEITKKALWWRDLENAVMSREEPVLRQAELRIFTPPDHEGVVLVEGEVAAGLRTCNYVKRYAH